MEKISIIYTKAKNKYAEQMARLITDELGTCDFDELYKNKVFSYKEIQSLSYGNKVNPNFYKR